MPTRPALWPAVRLLPPRVQWPPVGIGAAVATSPTGPAAVGPFLQLGVVMGTEGSKVAETVGLRRDRQARAAFDVVGVGGTAGAAGDGTAVGVTGQAVPA